MKIGEVIDEDSLYYGAMGDVIRESKDSYTIRLYNYNKKEHIFNKENIKVLAKKIYSPWAYSDKEEMKFAINRIIYEEIKDKAKVSLVNTCYGYKKYKVKSNLENLSEKELALIADKGNLCFGYRVENGYIIIHID